MLTSAEQRVCAAVDERRDELVRLASTLIGFDTTARDPGDPPRQERLLQEHLAGRLDRTGAELDLWEPDSEALAGKPLVPPGLDFHGRPQLIARRQGRGGGRSLTFNGHIDVVSVESSKTAPVICEYDCVVTIWSNEIWLAPPCSSMRWARLNG